MPRTHERRSYQQFCPISRSLDLLGERWTILIVRELAAGPRRYTDLRDHLPGMWSNLLAQRLRDLEAAGIVRRAELPPPAARTVYELTPRGRELVPVLYELARFGLAYLDLPTEDQPLLPHLLPEGIRAMALIEALPSRPFVAHLALDVGDYTITVSTTGAPLVERIRVREGRPAGADVTLRGSLVEMLWVRRGDASLDATNITIEGSPRHVAALRDLFDLHER